MLILCMALALRVLRGLCRWDEWALHYSAYYAPIRLAFEDGDWSSMGRTWTGLHPPLYGILHALMSALFSAPGLWLAFSVGVSFLAVLALLRSKGDGAWLAAVILATDPVQLHYAAEINNYPLMVCTIGLAWWARSHQRWLLLGLVGGIAAWTHILAGVTVGAMVMTSPRRWHSLAVMAAGAAPLVAGAADILTDMGHRSQPPLDLMASARDALSRFSPSFLLLLPLLIRGIAAQPAAAITWGAATVFWLSMVGFSLAAPHQFPYALALGVPAAVLVASGARGPRAQRFVLAVCLMRGLWCAAQDVDRVHTIWTHADASKAVGAVLAAAGPGDAVVLLRGLQEQDDDKRHISPVLWRFPPWEPMEDRTHPQIVEAPHRQGNPRGWRDLQLYTYDQPRPSIAQIKSARVFTIVYGAATHGTSPPLHPSQGERRRFGTIEVIWPSEGPEASAPD